MAVQFISVKCPECGANLSVEAGRESFFCSYCGVKVMVVNNNEHIYRTIDEAGIKQAETERVVRMRELELEENENKSGSKKKFIAYGMAIAFAAAGVLLFLVSKEAGSVSLIMGLFIGLFAFTQYAFETKKKPRKYVSPDDFAITDGMTRCAGKHINGIALLFRSQAL